jgi:hypothetical protein
MARRREKRECRAVVLEPDAADMTSTPFLIHLLKVPYTPTLPRHHQL